MFVEVKIRRRGGFVSAAEAVDGRKLERLQRLALACAQERGSGGHIRLIFAAVTLDRSGTSVDLIEVAG